MKDNGGHASRHLRAQFTSKPDYVNVNCFCIMFEYASTVFIPLQKQTSLEGSFQPKKVTVSISF